MSSSRKIAHFKLGKLISENNLTQSWFSTNLKTGRKCFVKSIAPNSSIGHDSAKSILARSFDCQKALRSRKILTASAKYDREGNLFIEYSYLDLSKWRAVTPGLFWQHFPSILVEACVVIDYLHLMGLVHGDLKLHNILVNAGCERLQIKLIDLDFLTTSHSSPNAKVFGTPEHVAPEIVENDLITTESDNYSLGVSLKTYLQSLEEDPLLPGPKAASSLEKVTALADNLTETDRLHRPRILLDALYNHEIIDRQAFELSQKTLLTMKLSTSFRRQRSQRIDTTIMLGDYLAKEPKVLGLAEDLISDLEAAFKRNPVATLLLFRSLVREANVTMHGDYWQLSVPDELAVAMFTRAEQIQHPRSAALITTSLETGSDIDQLVTKALELKRAGSYLKSFLCLKKALSEIERTGYVENVQVRKTILVELGSLARTLNRPKEAACFLTMALDLLTDVSEERLNVLHDLIYLNLSIRKVDAAETLIHKGLEEACNFNKPKFELRFQKQSAWVLAIRGEFADAKVIYETLIRRTEELGFDDLLVKLYSDLGTLAWRKGDFSESKTYFQISVGLARQNDLLSEAVTPTRNLSLVCHELSEYKNAVKYGKLALKSLAQPSDHTRRPFIYSTIALAYVRLGEYHKAQYWLQKSVAGRSILQDRVLFGEYYQFLGWLQMNQGNLLVARESLYKALEVLGLEKPNKTAGKVYHALAEIALYEGDFQACSRHVDRARGIFEKLGDTAACAEIELVGELNSYYYGDGETLSDLIQQSKSLHSHSCRYYAVLCLFHLLVQAKGETLQAALNIAGDLRLLTQESETPLYAAVAGLIAFHSDQETDRRYRLKTLKAVYRTLERAGHTFLALLVCERISACYADESKGKLARKFLSQSLKLARTLRNQRLIQVYSERLKSPSLTTFDQQRLVQSIHGVSEILKRITDYQEALQKVVQYAVDETGAERGVLLLKADDKSDLQVKAFVDCDESSLIDIKHFSRALPRQVATDPKPLVIDNALTDRRTKGYESIVVHNILSVVCMPVIIKDKLLGVLYLDHHTIPALFERDDITFVSSIANFVSVILTYIQDFRSVSLSRDRLLNELTQRGVHQPLITQDRVMLDMLSRLPEIARTNASILIIGESGTGKEILCEMIHDSSLRSDGPLVKLNCAAIPGTLIESELFGVAKNVATGVGERDGKFSAADGGTLFLDEIGDLPLEVQAKVLRVLEYQQFERVGSNRTTSTDIRFIYATNKDLKRLIREGKFREDLYYRINTITIELPPLREKPGDIMLLVKHFMKVYAHDKVSYPRFSAGAIEALLAYPWPGNIRELRNLVERLCILCPGRLVEISDLPKEFLLQQGADAPSRQSVEVFEKATIRELLSANNWNQSKVARIMNIPLTTLRRRIKKYRITKQL